MWVEKLQIGCFFLLVLLLPSQLGWHFWPDWSVIHGIRVDYFSPTIYLTDIIVGAIFFLEIIKNKKESLLFMFQTKTLIVVGLLGVCVFLNIYLSVSPSITLYKWIKIFEFGLLGWWIIKNKKVDRSLYIIVPLLGVGVVFLSTLVVWQFINQGSIGGWWYFLGERTFNPVTPGIANTFFAGQLILRPYGTLPHPNVLAGFLGLVLLILSAEYMRKKCVKSTSGVGFRAFWCLVFVAGQTALFLSLSRSAITAYLIGLAVIFFYRFNSKRRFVVLALFFLICLLTVGPRIFAVEFELEPIATRIGFFIASWVSFTDALVIGNGLGTSPLLVGLKSSSYALRYQPPHSIFLVVLVETGLVGLIVFLIGTYKVLTRLLVGNKNNRRSLLMAIFIFVLITGVTDHYWITLQQGILSIMVLSGIAMSTSRS